MTAAPPFSTGGKRRFNAATRSSKSLTLGSLLEIVSGVTSLRGPTSRIPPLTDISGFNGLLACPRCIRTQLPLEFLMPRLGGRQLDGARERRRMRQLLQPRHLTLHLFDLVFRRLGEPWLVQDEVREPAHDADGIAVSRDTHVSVIGFIRCRAFDAERRHKTMLRLAGHGVHLET